jgi:predicted dehydrogenase
MLSTSPLDLILILSPSELHVPQALLCLKHGKHIFIEKPLANTLSEVDALEKARAESGMIVFVGYMRRYAGAVEVVKRRLEGKGIKYVRVRELIGSVSLFPTSLLLLSWRCSSRMNVLSGALIQIL